ncbi:hypothetical protein J3459_008004 [Metarhizium acridum]|nr:hypothetical protein J3459_008004 [Metarhizium acridum]
MSLTTLITLSLGLLSFAAGKPGGKNYAYSIADGEPSTSGLFGVSYAAYRSDQNCKSQQDVDDDIQRLAGYYSFVRAYGTDYDQVPMLYSAAKKHGMKLFLGIRNPSSVEDEANKIISGVDGDWDMVHTVSVGTERVSSGETSPKNVTWSMSKARSILREAGYDGPVVIVDTFTAVLAHPSCVTNTVTKVQSRIAANKKLWLPKLVGQCRVPRMDLQFRVWKINKWLKMPSGKNFLIGQEM